MRFGKEFERYLAELFDYNEDEIDAILGYLGDERFQEDEELYEDFLREGAE